MLTLFGLYLKDIVTIWITFGALSGSMISGIDKLQEIWNEPPRNMRYPVWERPIICVYHSSRIAGASGFGAAIGGLVAATAPLSIPLYIFWNM